MRSLPSYAPPGRKCHGGRGISEARPTLHPMPFRGRLLRRRCTQLRNCIYKKFEKDFVCLRPSQPLVFILSPGRRLSRGKAITRRPRKTYATAELIMTTCDTCRPLGCWQGAEFVPVHDSPSWRDTVSNVTGFCSRWMTQPLCPREEPRRMETETVFLFFLPMMAFRWAEWVTWLPPAERSWKGKQWWTKGQLHGQPNMFIIFLAVQVCPLTVDSLYQNYHNEHSHKSHKNNVINVS